MGGCLRSLGCLFLLLIAAATAYVMRDHIPWRDAVAWVRGQREAPRAELAPAGPEWALLTQEGAARAEATVRRMGEHGGPRSASVAPADLAAYIFQEASRRLLPSGQDVRAAVIDSQLHIRGRVPSARLVAEFGIPDAVAGMLRDEEEVHFAGTFELVRPGLAQYRVRSLEVGGFNLSRLAPQLIRKIGRGTRPEGIANDALPMEVPPYIGGVRVGRGRVTIFRRAA